jgi:hypothetical protein
MTYREIAVRFCAIAVPTRGDEVGRRWRGLTWRQFIRGEVPRRRQQCA